MSGAGDLGRDCSCGDRCRPNINHRKTIPCWTFVGTERVNIGTDGMVARTARPRSTWVPRG